MAAQENRRDDAAPEKIFRAWATDQEYGALALFAQAGYTPVRHYILMTRTIDAPCQPRQGRRFGGAPGALNLCERVGYHASKQRAFFNKPMAWKFERTKMFVPFVLRRKDYEPQL